MINKDDILTMIPEGMEAAPWLHGFGSAVKLIAQENDMDAFRNEVAKSVFAGFATGVAQKEDNVHEFSESYYADLAVKWATALVYKLAREKTGKLDL